ncbi:DUF1489 family protein [Erythrobacter neustonensis]|uniref:Lysophospholipase n=1 Tax=Erythrobacter neustonensis TaxID=1112 RepID=A0A192D0H1_9SPHN|nr:DUF1489 domain-containing protein [Erythrobacter neustonensis]ANK11645.1 hypothetical protein A9D12_00295 [Erythrobacter neustonensis]
MPLHLTKIAFGAKSYDQLASRISGRQPIALTTRNRPTRFEECAGGSLYWIINHAIVARSPIIGFEKTRDGRWDIMLEPKLIRVHQIAKRAHQGWRYLTEDKAPKDVAEGEDIGDALPGKLAMKLERLGLV